MVYFQYYLLYGLAILQNQGWAEELGSHYYRFRPRKDTECCLHTFAFHWYCSFANANYRLWEELFTPVWPNHIWMLCKPPAPLIPLWVILQSLMEVHRFLASSEFSIYIHLWWTNSEAVGIFNLSSGIFWIILYIFLIVTYFDSAHSHFIKEYSVTNDLSPCWSGPPNANFLVWMTKILNVRQSTLLPPKLSVSIKKFELQINGTSYCIAHTNAAC